MPVLLRTAMPLAHQWQAFGVGILEECSCGATRNAADRIWTVGVMTHLCPVKEAEAANQAVLLKIKYKPDQEAGEPADVREPKARSTKKDDEPLERLRKAIEESTSPLSDLAKVSPETKNNHLFSYVLELVDRRVIRTLFGVLRDLPDGDNLHSVRSRVDNSLVDLLSSTGIRAHRSLMGRLFEKRSRKWLKDAQGKSVFWEHDDLEFRTTAEDLRSGGRRLLSEIAWLEGDPASTGAAVALESDSQVSV